MFSDEEIKESSLIRPGDEIISIREVCLIDKYDKKYLGGEPLLSNSGRSELEVPRLFRDGFFSEGLDPQARFAWTEEDGNIASLVSEPGFGTTGTTFGKDFDVALSTEMKEVTSSSGFEITRNKVSFQNKSQAETNTVSSTSTTSATGLSINQPKGRNSHKVDKTDPRSRYHYVKYVKRNGRTVKLWECGICSREFQHQYTLMRHLPTHTDERNFHCDECSKSFRQLSTLSQHRAIHSAERPYACEVCTKTFNRVSTLISHRKTHSDEKPYKCHICPKGFHQKGNLRNHLFTHTNERPYRCNICMKGFNQQSNLVCHKNKAHPDENSVNVVKSRSTPRNPVLSATETQTDTNPPSEQCEVTSSVDSYLPSTEQLISIWPKPIQLDAIKPASLSDDSWNESSWGSNGVIVDPIKTYHMEIALATRQTPFALLKSDNSTPVLVKVIDTKLPGGKQILVPATAEDLKIGGRIVLNEEGAPTKQGSKYTDGKISTLSVDLGNVATLQDAIVSCCLNPEISLPTTSEANNALQIRVPVVATVVPKIRPGGKLQLSVEEPHHVYHGSLSSTGGEAKENPYTTAVSSIPTTLPPLEPLRRLDLNTFNEQNNRAGTSCSPAPSSPFDLISLDLFEPIGCIPLGPQITSVDNIENRPPSEDSDIFIEKFEEIIPLSDSD